MNSIDFITNTAPQKKNTTEEQFDLGLIAKDMLVCQVLSTAFPIFYEKTGISPKFVFSYNENGLMFDIGFAPREPNREEWNVLIEEIFESEKLIHNNHILKKIHSKLNGEQLMVKLTEEIKLIAQRRKAFYLNNPKV